MYKFDKRIWNHRIRRTVIVSLVVPLLSTMPQAPIAVAAPACVEGTHYSRVSSAGAATVVYRFTNTSAECTFALPTGLTSASILAVGAGGGGGPDGGAGGGGGELRFNATQSLSGVSSIDIWVGTGGNGGAWGGGNSVSGTSTTVKWNGSTQYQANGGSRADGWSSSGPPGGAGGSGGTGGNINTNGQQGGSGPSQVCTTGLTPPGTVPSNSITGSSVNYGGGGGGGMGNNNQNVGTAYLGAAGGGTSGGRGSNFKLATDGVTAINGASNGSAGTANTGGGGGGGSACDARGPYGQGHDGVTQRTAGGRGADGVVILSFSRISQTISFGSIASRRVTAGTVTTTPTSSSGLTVVLTSATTSVCTVSGFVITPVSAGTCTINANQAGTNDYAPATQVQQSFAIMANMVTYNSNTATTTRPIESTTANTVNTNTLSSGRLAQGSPISNGLVLHLDGADRSTVSGSTWTNKVAGVSGAEASATASGSPIYDPSDGSFSLNGTNQVFTLGSTNYLYNGALPFTVNLSFKASDVNRDNCLIGNFNGGVGATYMFRLSSGVLVGNRNVAPWQVDATTRLSAGEIYYASMSFDGTNLRLYLNGNLHATSATISASVNHNGGARIGGCLDSSANSRMFKGKIYNAQIYNRALSAAEITTNYQNLIPAQQVAKTNYTLGPWTTAADTGTAFGTTNYDLSALPTPHFRVSAENYSGGTLSASVGGSRLSITKNGSPTLNANSGGGYGANARFATISGGTGDGFRLGNAELPNYTFCGMARYKNLDTGVKGTQGRIFAYGSGTNWLSGWYDNSARNFFHNAWLIGPLATPDQQWHVVCDSGNDIYWDGVKQAVTSVAYTSLPPLALNWSASGDNSSFEFTEAIVYDQALSQSQIAQIFRYFENKFGMTNITISAQSATSLNAPTNYSPTGDATLFASWFSLITYDGNKQTSGVAPASHAVTNTGGTVAAVGTLARAGYQFAGWNTAADGSGTRYAAGAQLANIGNQLLYAQWVLPVAFPVAATNPTNLSPYMRFVASDYDATNKVWRDSSGNSRNATRIVGTPTLTTTTGNGASKSIQVLSGGISDKIYFDNQEISTSWTVLALSRYSGASNRNRIVTGNYAAGIQQDGSADWLLGQHSGNVGMAHYNGWVSPTTTTVGLTLTDWVMSTAFPSNYRYNGISRGTSGGTAVLPPLGINTWTGEQSDYQVAEVIIYNRTLTASEIGQVEDYFDETYGLAYAKVGTYRTSPTLSVSATFGGRSDTYTAINGFGNKTFTISPTIAGITIDTSTANGVAIVVASTVAAGTYLETITATDSIGNTSLFAITITVVPPIKWSTSNSTTLVTTVGKSASLRLDITSGLTGRVASITRPTNLPSLGITMDTSTLVSSGYVTLNVSAAVLPGTYSLTMVVNDILGRAANQIVTVTVNNLPSLTFTPGVADTTTTVTTNGLWLQYEIGRSWAGVGTSVVDLTENNAAAGISSGSVYNPTFGGGSVALSGTKLIWLNTGVIAPTDSLSKFYWIYPTAATGTIVTTCNAGCGYHESEFEMLNGRLHARVWALGSVASTETIALNEWHYVGYIYDRAGGTTQIYIDGRLAGSVANSGTRGPPDGVTQYDGISLGDSTNMVTSANGQFSFGGAHYYKRALSAQEVFFNYASTASRYLGSSFPGRLTSGTATIATTQGVASSYSVFSASSGTGSKVISISPLTSGVTIDTSTPGTAILNLANTLTATNSTTARVISQTVVATDSVTAITNYPVQITVNPPIAITAAIPNTITSTFGVAISDTFTAAYGTGTLRFSHTPSSNASAFTLRTTSPTVAVLTVANNLPAGTYQDTITVTDSASAVTNYVLTIVVNPRITISGATTSSVSTTIGKATSLRINVVNGSGARTLSFTSPNSGITIDSSTISSNYVTFNVSSSTPANTFSLPVTARDSLGVTSSETFTIVVNKAPKIAGPPAVTSGLELNFDAGSAGSYSGTGTTWNSTVGGRSVTLLGTSGLPSYSSDSGGLINFNSTNLATQKHYAAGSISNTTLTSYTVEAWAKFATLPTGEINALVSDKYQTKINYELFYGAINVGNCVGVGLRIAHFNGSWSCSKAVTGIAVNTWYHIVGTYNPTDGFKMFVNGVLQSGASAPSTVAASSDSSNREIYIAKRHDASDQFFPGSIPVVRVYNRALTAAEALQNYNAIAYRYVNAASGNDSITVTAGRAGTVTGVLATDGTGDKTFTLSGLNSGISISSPSANQFTLGLSANLTSIDSATARTIFETVTATDSTTASTTFAYSVVVNPLVRLVAFVDSITTTSGIAAFDTFTAVTGTGTGNKTFTFTGSPTTTGFTLTQASNVAVLKVEPTANPGTYYETITATDSLGATASKMVTFVVNPAPTITGPTTAVMTNTISYKSPNFTISNGTGTLTTVLTGTLASSYVSIENLSASTFRLSFLSTTPVGNYIETLTVTDSKGATGFLVFTIVVNGPVTLTGTQNLNTTYGTSTTALYQSAAGSAPYVLGGSNICATTKITNGLYTVEEFRASLTCNWSVPTGVTSLDAFVVGGGGGGGFGSIGGGGGAGQVLVTSTPLAVTSGTSYSVKVGSGGFGARNDATPPWSSGGDGTSSFFGSFTATGGGAGAGDGGSVGSAGGSGGGGTAVGSAAGGASNKNSYSGWVSYGNSGGAGANSFGGGGGGGAGASGQTSTVAGVGGTGGAGVTISNFKNGDYKVGGGGGGWNGGTGATVFGGGNSVGADSSYSCASTPCAGGINTGGGGGAGVKGGTGLVVVKYLTPTELTTDKITATVINSGTSPAQLSLNVPEFVNAGTYTQTLSVTDNSETTYPYTVTINVAKATPTVSLSLPGAVTTAKYGTAISVSALASTAGRVVFKNGSNIISGCESVTASVTGVATCSWTPTALGAAALKATLTPTDANNYNKSNETSFTVTVGKADTLTVTASDESLTFTGSTALVTKPFTQSGLVSIDSLTVVSMIYTGTANNGTSYSSSTAPTLAGTYVVTPDTSTAGISTIAGNYLGVTVVPGTFSLNRARNTSSLVYPTVNTNSAVTSPPATNYITYKTGITDTPTTRSRLGNGAIMYSTTTPTKCSVDSSTAVMSLIEAGSCVVNMTVDQGDNYLADSATATIEIAKGNRTITLTSATLTLKYTETATVTTTISDGALDGSLTYSLNSSSGCSFDSFGGILTATSGTLACSLNVTIGEGTNFLSATPISALAMTIAKANAPIITIDTVAAVDYSPGNRAAIFPTYSFSGFKGSDAASSLTLTYSFVSNPFEVFFYSDTRTPIDAGTYRITPSAIVMSSGLATNYETPNYSAAAINFIINRIAQDPVSIDGVNGEVNVPFPLIYRGGNNPTATPTFTKVSGASCIVSITGQLDASAAGVCVVTVTVPGNRNYLAITSETITVRVRNFTLVPVFIFGNGSTGITIAPNTTLTIGEAACTTGCVPTLTAISPYDGAEGDVITLTGTNFTGAIRVIFNVFTNAITFNVDSDTQISVQIPGGLTVGDGTIEVVTPGGITARWFDFGVLP